jgi:PAS domain-containing protein
VSITHVLIFPMAASGLVLAVTCSEPSWILAVVPLVLRYSPSWSRAVCAIALITAFALVLVFTRQPVNFFEFGSIAFNTIFRFVGFAAALFAGGRLIERYLPVSPFHDQDHEARKKRDGLLRAVIDALPVYLWCDTPNCEPSHISKKLIEYAGGRDASDEGSIARATHPDDFPRLSSSRQHGIQLREPFKVRYRLKRFDGEYRWIEERSEPLFDENGRIAQWCGILIDVHEEVLARSALVSAQDGLVRSTRAATLSELSALLGHQINQPLAAIAANGYACQHWLSAEPPNVERARITVQRILRDADDAAQIIRSVQH